MNFKHIGIFLIGFGVGALVATKMLKQQYEDILQEEIESIKQVEERKKKINEKTDSDDEDYILGVDLGTEVETYEAIASKYEHPMDDGERKRPYEISDEQFAESMDCFDKISLFYYSDDVLADESEEIVDDVERAVGIKLLMDWAGDPDKSETLYVRNENMSIDYEIVRMEQAYSEMVCGGV